jgi:hypothetical protein
VAWVAAWGASRSRAGLPLLLAGAALFRLAILPLEPDLSQDVHRYVWEGRVQNAGFDPYVLPPSAPELASLRDASWDHINYKDASAIYPPVAQLVFSLLAGVGGVTLFKTVFCILDLGVIACLGLALRRRGLPVAKLALYAWNPLAVVEIAGSGHLEPLGILPLVVALVFVSRRRALAWAALAASAGVKYTALAVLPFHAQACRPRWRDASAGVLVLGLSTAVYAHAGAALFRSLRMYAEHWRYNDLVFSLLQSRIDSPLRARWVAAGLFVALCAGLWRARARLETKAMAALAGALLLSPTVHPWYLLWPVALMPLRPTGSLFVWSGTIALSYLFLYPAFGAGPLPVWSWSLKWIEMAPVLALLSFELWKRSRQGSAAA